MRPYFLAGNWKLHKTPSEAVAYAKELAEAFASVTHRVMVAPTYVCIPQVAEVLKGSPVLVGAQNCAAAESGAHTGEVAPAMLKEAGVDVVILGHSERRSIYGESDETINQKVKLALSAGLEVILCVGETLDEREAGKAMQVVEDQLRKGLAGITGDQLDKITIAYEPVWAIGTGKTATPQDANEIHQGAREVLADIYSTEAAEAMVIQYGGSVKPANVKELMAMEHIDGALVGGASLTIENFAPIVQFDKE
ncbi:triose-phosphate isomerase [Spirochaeta africana]|uniref:Triosephosphate isomerase n=1 Tax=Spirochaeta africana (strain ATCC 700263 / DSM 8902 / Z-7692) TaxID=889378 RepID=H9UJJ6_SPIAZ|nr:triose-phosphate isomerase [Spirochaeta africana]AFG37689.1 triosephosphate isomerase [Spirochaeta africana DSM 8902]